MMVGRFQVMALLQAARARALGYRLDEAESFGLNRAIFYAAAKRGCKGGTGAKHPGEQQVLRETSLRKTSKTIQQDALGDEIAYYVEIDGKRRYVMGEEILEPDDFGRQVEQRFGQAFPEVWQQALQIIEQADKAALASQRRFYEEVYKPRRDELAKAWSALSKQARSCFEQHDAGHRAAQSWPLALGAPFRWIVSPQENVKLLKRAIVRILSRGLLPSSHKEDIPKVDRN